MAAPARPVFGQLRVKFDESSDVVHNLFYKLHKGKSQDNERPVGRTLVVGSIPPYCKEACLHRIFSTKFGPVEKVMLSGHVGHEQSKVASKFAPEELTEDDLKFFPPEKQEGATVGFVVFDEASSLERALNSKSGKKPHLFSLPGKPISTGMRKWVKEYRHQLVDKRELQANVDAYMVKYDAAVVKAETEEQDEGLPDEEGWVKVTRKGKNPVIPTTEANQIKARAKEKRKKKRRELFNIYSYQIRETKREKIADLRRKFEEDKERVKNMRQARKFRPF